MAGAAQLPAIRRPVGPEQVPPDLMYPVVLCENGHVCRGCRFDIWTREFGMDGAQGGAAGSSDAMPNQPQPVEQQRALVARDVQQKRRQDENFCVVC